LKLTQCWLAEQLHISQGYLADLERGRRTNPSEALRLRLDQLFRDLRVSAPVTEREEAVLLGPLMSLCKCLPVEDLEILEQIARAMKFRVDALTNAEKRLRERERRVP